MDNVVLSDRNAANDYVAFYPVRTGLNYLDFEKIYSRFWTHDDPMAKWIHGSMKCAEALVPNSVPVEYITGIIVYNDTVKTRLELMGIRLQITVEGDMFF